MHAGDPVFWSAAAASDAADVDAALMLLLSLGAAAYKHAVCNTILYALKLGGAGTHTPLRARS